MRMDQPMDKELWDALVEEAASPRESPYTYGRLDGMMKAWRVVHQLEPASSEMHEVIERLYDDVQELRERRHESYLDSLE